MLLDVDDYQSQIAEIRLGKRVGTSIYLHVDCVPEMPEGMAAFLTSVSAIAKNVEFLFNVYKLDIRAPLVSLLDYPDFFEEAFPTLSKSATWSPEADSLKIREYPDPNSKPVLHRKELLLPTGYEDLNKFAELTEAAEYVGLFDESAKIGRQSFWTSRMEELGVEVVGHVLQYKNGERVSPPDDRSEILRYRTALKRNRLSVPVQALYKHALISDESTFFDYGCGKGDDIRLLSELGVSASGWDPHFANNVAKSTADIVNLGYVVNVIENPRERRDVISAAFDLSTKMLVISALVGVPSYGAKVRKFGDGFLTSTGTFQKYFQTSELIELVRDATGRDPFPVGPGILIVFSDEKFEQIFLQKRLEKNVSRRIRARVNNVDQLSDAAKVQAENYWRACIELGRPAMYSEIDDCDELPKMVPSSARLFDIVSKEKDAEEFQLASENRKNDLLVDFALSRFGKRLFFKYLSDTLKHDVKYHFGTYSLLQNASEELLYSIADIDALHCACSAASDNGIGYLTGDHSLQLHLSLLTKLNPILRVYVGCAGLLYGEWSQIDLAKIHIQSGKVSFMGYDDFEGRPIPNLLERIKVRLWDRGVEFFDYIGEFVPTPLFMKSLFIDDSFEYFEEQVVFDRALMQTNLLDFNRENISNEKFNQLLNSAGYEVRGFDLVRVA